MGNSSDSTKKLAEISFLQTISHPELGSIDIFKGPKTTHLLKLTEIVRNQSKDKFLRNLIQKLTAPDCKAVVPINHFQQKKGVGCSYQLRLELFMPYYNFKLTDLIQQKKKKNRKVQQSQLWYIMKALMEASKYARDQSISIIFHPKMIFLSPLGQIKVYIHLLHKLKENSYHWAIEGVQQLRQTFLSPQELRCIRRGMIQSNCETSSVFSIGLTVLQTASLQFSGNLYRRDYSFDERKSVEIIRDSAYSQEFKLLLTSCLSNDPAFRFTQQESLDFISQQQSQGLEVNQNIKLVEIAAKENLDVKRSNSSLGQGQRKLSVQNYSNKKIRAMR